jgi:hypothetical protein
MIRYARLRPGPGFQPIQAVLYYAQRLVTVPVLRRGISLFLSMVVNALQGNRPARRTDAVSARVLHELKTNGVALLAPFAAAGGLETIVDYFRQQQVIGPDGRRVAFAALPEGTPAAAYDLQTVVNCPGLLELVNAPEMLRIVEAYLGCKPTLSSLGVRWSLPAVGDVAHFQRFHRDVDDWRFLKLFVYLTDVDSESGPHCYVCRSHRRAFSVRAHAYRPGEVEARYGAENLKTIPGPPGTTFLADTLGVHRGGVVRERGRLILQAQYSILPVFAFSYSPLNADAKLDRYINRLIVRTAALGAGSTL